MECGRAFADGSLPGALNHFGDFPLEPRNPQNGYAPVCPVTPVLTKRLQTFGPCLLNPLLSLSKDSLFRFP